MQRISQFFPLEKKLKQRELKNKGITTTKKMESLAFDFKVAIIDVFR